ncbi:hypothetical protein PIROE2DRAFT_9428 [Piromyces sp. E2]|nr:hypothetical protein PIROE2DRAFT_9428 [Piromyces sp. E2]|eukprot:OUM63967.1 hypothetical protein PIROE2DRAFT_9428 [Piromyces sp. E2]
MASGMNNDLYLGNNYTRINRMKRCKSDNISLLLHDTEQKEVLKTLHKSYSCPNFSLELNESNLYSKNKDGEDSKSTISCQYYLNTGSFIDKKKRGSMLSSFQSKLNTISYMFTKTSNNLRIFSKNVDNSINKLTTSKEKFSGSTDFHNNDALSMKYSYSKNSVRSEFNNRTKFSFKPHHHHHHQDKFSINNRSNKSNIHLKENENHNLTKMNIFSKNKDYKDYGEMSKSKSSFRLRRGTTMSFRSFKSARTINEQDKSFKSFKSFNNCDSLSKQVKGGKKGCPSETSSIKMSSDNISNTDKGRRNKELDKLLHSKQGSIISKNPSIKSKIMRISKISSLKKKGKSLYNELSKEFRSSSTSSATDELFPPNNNKLTSTDSFSDWFNSISSVPHSQGQTSPSSSISQGLSTVSVQSPLSNEITFDSPPDSSNNSDDKIDSNNININSSTSTPLTQSFSVNNDPPSSDNVNEKNDRKKIVDNKTIKKMDQNGGSNSTNNIKNQNKKIDLTREVSFSKKLPPLPIGLKYKGDNVR